MSGPCLHDSTTILLDIDTDGLSLIAHVANQDTTFSATQGDDTTHVVTDHNVEHVQTQSLTVHNAGTSDARGTIIVALNPIWCGLPDGPCSLIWEASLTIGGVLADQRDTITTPLIENQVLTFSPGSLVGEIDVAAGASVVVAWEKRIENDGASAQWSFRMGGDKLVGSLGY